MENGHTNICCNSCNLLLMSLLIICHHRGCKMGGSVKCVLKKACFCLYSDGMGFFSGERVFTNL